jgi:hypothetical protein
MVAPPHFDHERLDVYQLELKFLSWVTDARGSAIECAACLEASVAKGFASSDRIPSRQRIVRSRRSDAEQTAHALRS